MMNCIFLIFCVSNCASKVYQVYEKSIFKCSTDLKSPHWNVYVLHRAGLSNKGAVLDLLHVSDIKKHTALWKSQGLNLSCSVISLRKPISSSPSSKWLISLHLDLTRLAGTYTLVSVIVPWHEILAPCVRNQRDDFWPSLFSAGMLYKLQLLLAHHVAWRYLNYVWIVFVTLYFLKKPHKNLAMQNPGDLPWVCSQWTSSWFWIFCLIHYPGT